jgi:hypothetical protein
MINIYKVSFGNNFRYSGNLYFDTFKEMMEFVREMKYDKFFIKCECSFYKRKSEWIFVLSPCDRNGFRMFLENTNPLLSDIVFDPTKRFWKGKYYNKKRLNDY